MKGKEGPECSEFGRASFWNHAREPWTCTEESKSVLITITLIEYFIFLFSICSDNVDKGFKPEAHAPTQGRDRKSAGPRAGDSGGPIFLKENGRSNEISISNMKLD